jgi:hypothetical protein
MKRIGSKGYARARAAEDAGEGPPSDREDDDEDEPDAMAGHEPLRAAAEEAHTKAAAAYGASKGSDSAALLMAADQAGDAAGEAHQAAKASSAKMRGATVEEAPTDPKAPPAPPAAPGARVNVVQLARAIATSGGTAETQALTLSAVGFADRMAALFGGASLDETEGYARAALADAADAKQLRAVVEKTKASAAKRAETDAETALRAEVTAAVTARKYDKAELTDPDANAPGGWTPKAHLREMSAKTRAALFASKQARASSSGPGAGPLIPDDSVVQISAAVLDYGQRRGWPDGDPRYAAMAATLPTVTGASAPSTEATS